MPFRELEHTADRCLRVWARDLPALFSEAARGMIALAGMQAAPAPRLRRQFETSAPDAESLLVAFLAELLFAAEHEKWVYHAFRFLRLEPGLQVEMEGSPLVSIRTNIKAVTYHNLQIRKTRAGWRVDLVFDV